MINKALSKPNSHKGCHIIKYVLCIQINKYGEQSAWHDYQNKLTSASFYKNKPEPSKQITLIPIDLPYFPGQQVLLM